MQTAELAERREKKPRFWTALTDASQARGRLLSQAHNSTWDDSFSEVDHFQRYLVESRTLVLRDKDHRSFGSGNCPAQEELMQEFLPGNAILRIAYLAYDGIALSPTNQADSDDRVTEWLD